MFYNKLSPIKQKKAAIEMSIGTIVIIVIAMTMLIMGIVLVRNIFGGATDSVSSLNDKVSGEIASLFTEEGEKIIIYGAGADRTIKIKRGTESFGFVISAVVENTANGGTSTTSNKLKYRLVLETSECSRETFKTYFKNPQSSAFTGTDPSTSYVEFDDFDNPQGDALILLSVPKDANTCVQKIRVYVKDESVTPAAESSKTFSIQIVSGGLFG